MGVLLFFSCSGMCNDRAMVALPLVVLLVVWYYNLGMVLCGIRAGLEGVSA